MRRLFLLLATVALFSCNGDSPTDPLQSLERGRLSGIVTIGPNCPGPATPISCPTPPSAYAARKILVYDEAGVNLLHTVDIDSQGAYLIDLAPRTYTIDLKKSGIDRVTNLPVKVTISRNTVTMLNVEIDTGIR